MYSITLLSILYMPAYQEPQMFIRYKDAWLQWSHENWYFHLGISRCLLDTVILKLFFKKKKKKNNKKVNLPVIMIIFRARNFRLTPRNQFFILLYLISLSGYVHWRRRQILPRWIGFGAGAPSQSRNHIQRSQTWKVSQKCVLGNLRTVP